MTDTTTTSAAQWQAPRFVHSLWDRGFRFLFVLDTVALALVLVGVNLIRFGSDWPEQTAGFYVVGFAAVSSIHLVVGYFMGLYVREPRLGTRSWLPRVMAAVTIGVLIDALIALATDRFLVPRGNLVGLLIGLSILWTLNRRLSRFLADRRSGPARVVLLGATAETELSEAHMRTRESRVSVVARIDDVAELRSTVEQTEATDVLLLNSQALNEVFPAPASELELLGIGLLQRVGAQETLLGLQSVREIAGMPFVVLRGHALPPHKAKLKRLVELLVVIGLLPFIVLLTASVAIYVRLFAGAPVIYRQNRVGRDRLEFRIFKFRTMVLDAEQQSGAVLAEEKDPRVIPACRWLRKTRFDELPQVWNVVRGDMSLIGPRPERPELTVEFERDIPGYARRHEIAPGITGLAQISGRYDTDARFKLGYDLQYLVNWSVVLDLQILLRTVWVVVTRRV